MKKTLLFALAAAAATFGAAPQAQARDACGQGFHRNVYGHCVINHRMNHREVLIVGRYYPHQGWWDGRRYYRHRYMHHNHWRYR